MIAGPHTGKYGRRLYHSKKNGEAFMIFEVVTVAEGQKDTLTGEILENPTKQLCTVEESPNQKKLNRDIMKNSRQKYREQNKVQGR